MNSIFSNENQKIKLLEEELHPQIVKVQLNGKSDVYAEINNSSFHFSLKCLNENYKKKVQPDFTNLLE